MRLNSSASRPSSSLRWTRTRVLKSPEPMSRTRRIRSEIGALTVTRVTTNRMVPTASTMIAVNTAIERRVARSSSSMNDSRCSTCTTP